MFGHREKGLEDSEVGVEEPDEDAAEELREKEKETRAEEYYRGREEKRVEGKRTGLGAEEAGEGRTEPCSPKSGTRGRRWPEQESFW